NAIHGTSRNGTDGEKRDLRTFFIGQQPWSPIIASTGKSGGAQAIVPRGTFLAIGRCCQKRLSEPTLSPSSLTIAHRVGWFAILRVARPVPLSPYTRPRKQYVSGSPSTKHACGDGTAFPSGNVGQFLVVSSSFHLPRRSRLFGFEISR